MARMNPINLARIVGHCMRQIAASNSPSRRQNKELDIKNIQITASNSPSRRQNQELLVDIQNIQIAASHSPSRLRNQELKRTFR
jgi:hypothetical protein